MAANITVKIYDINTYSFGRYELAETEAPKPRIDKLTKLRQYYEKSDGCVKYVRAIILVHLHNHPHVLLLEKKSGEKKLPGGRLEPGEDDESGLLRLLGEKLRIEQGSYIFPNELVGCWYRPCFTEQLLPYCPVHISSPKEIEKWYLLILPPTCSFRIHPKYDLQAAAFYDLQDATLTSIYGQQLPLIPTLTSRFTIIPEDNQKKEETQ